MKFKLFKTGPIRTNTYIVWDDDSSDTAIIDPAGQVQEILNFVKENKLKVKYIINTHGHFDHILANKELSDTFKADILIHKDATEMLEDDERNHSLNYDMTVPKKSASKLLSENDTINLGSLNFKVIHTSGHSKGSICLYEKNEKVLISGDTLFQGTYGRVDLPESSPEDMKNSLQKLAELPKDSKVYPGHGNSTTIGYELAEGILRDMY